MERPTPAGTEIKVRRNRFLTTEKGLIGKVSRSLSADEHNIVFGLSSAVHAAAAAGQILSKNLARYSIIRRLVVVSGGVRGRIKSIKAEGNELLQGGSVPFEMFSATAVNSPTFDLPAGSGTPLEVTYDVDAACTVDMGFEID